MDIKEIDKIYNRIYDSFLELLSLKINEVVITPYEMYKLNLFNYVNILQENFKGKVEFSINPADNNYYVTRINRMRGRL